MSTIKYKVDEYGAEKIVLKEVNGQQKVGCECCDEWLIVDFSGYGVSGSICTPTAGFFAYTGQCWCEGGFYDGESNRQHIETNVGAARADGVWTSSVNFSVKAHSDEECDPYQPSGGICTGNNAGIRSGTLSVTYKGVTKSTDISLVIAEYGTNCSGEDVGKTITVYATPLGDGSYFEIV